MRFLCVVLAALSLSSLYAQQSWGPILTVNDDEFKGFTRPRVVLAAGDVPVVIWGRASNLETYAARFDGTSFSTVNRVTPSGVFGFAQTWAGPDIAAAGDTLFAVFKSQPDISGHVYCVRSLDGGLSWGDTVRVLSDTQTRFPAVAVGPGGNPVVAFMHFDPVWKDPRYAVSRSLDGGLTFLPEVNATAQAPGEVCDCCPPQIMTNGTSVYLSFRNNDHDLRDMWTTVSNDGGASFTAGADIDWNNWMIPSCPSTGADGLVIGDSMLNVWMSGASGQTRINFAMSHRQTVQTGQTGELTPGAPSTASQNYPRMSGSANGDTLAVVWQEGNQGKLYVLARFSTTGIAGLLAAPTDTIDDRGGLLFSPDVVYSPGRFHVVWQHASDKAVYYRTRQFGVSSASDMRPHWKLWPNPAGDQVYVEFPVRQGPVLYRLLDVQGRLAQSGKLDPTQSVVRLAGLPSGIYWLELDLGTGPMAAKLMKY